MKLPGQIADKLRQLLISVSIRGEDQGLINDVRKLSAGIGRAARKPGELVSMIKNISSLEQRQQRIAGQWLTSDDVAEMQSGAFDGNDLRNWLALAHRAGVPFIEAREIASFTAEEFAALQRPIHMGNNPIFQRSLDRARPVLEAAVADGSLGADADEYTPAEQDLEALHERLYAAMDYIPEGWMVRSHICGSSNLKSLAGCGVTENQAPEVRFGPDLEIGPGWVRRGNRRMIDISDQRTMKCYVENDTVPIAYLARPWVEASRVNEGRDPHRAGTPIDLPGQWPAEWRAFVCNGVVTGVANYYGWLGDVNPQTAEAALEVRRLAQMIVNEAIASGQYPQSMSIELTRGTDGQGRLDPALQRAGYMPGAFNATLDFIETANGLMLLEGGPGCSPIGGGHPCAFAGDVERIAIMAPNGEIMPMDLMPLEGVAFRTMSHVHLAEVSTWKREAPDGSSNRSDVILDWDKVTLMAGLE